MLSKGAAPDLLALLDAILTRGSEVNARVHTRVRIFLSTLRKACERARDLREGPAAGHTEAHLVRPEEPGEHGRCRASSHAVRRRVVGEGRRVHEGLPARIRRRSVVFVGVTRAD